MDNNEEQEKKIAVAERTAARLRLDYQDAEAQRDQFQSEVGVTFDFSNLNFDQPFAICF